MSAFMIRVIQFSFFAATIGILFLALFPVEVRVVGGHLSDKVNHALAFLVLTILGFLAFPGTKKWYLAGALIVFGLMIELIQMIPFLNRQAELTDLIANIAGVGAAWLVAAIFIRRKLSSASQS